MSKTTYKWVKNHDLRQLCTFTCPYFCARIRFGNRNYRESYYFTKSFQIFQTFIRRFCIYRSCPPAEKETGVFFYSQISVLIAPVVNWHKKSLYFCASCTLDISLSPL